MMTAITIYVGLVSGWAAAEIVAVAFELWKGWK